MMVQSSAQSVFSLFQEHVEQRGQKTGALVKRGGAYQDVTWAEMGDRVDAISSGLLALGVAAEDRVCVLADTSLEWVYADLGILGAGAVTVPIYPSNPPADCQYIVTDAGAVVVFAENAEQVHKLVHERSHMPTVVKVVQMMGEVQEDAEWVISLADLEQLGSADVAELQARRDSLTPDSILTLIYTSGTTGRPKGVITTHANMLYQAESIRSVDILRTDDVQLLFLPLAHSFAKVLEVAWLGTAHIVAFAESIETLGDNLMEVRPTLMGAVPRVFEKVYAAVVDKGLSAGGAKAAMFSRALQLSEKRGRLKQEGHNLGLRERLEFAALRKLVFAKIREGVNTKLGGRMRIMVSGGAPLSPAINHFFNDAGLTILEGYGLTETSAAAFVNRPGRNRIGTVGEAMPGTEVRIADDGEILLRGPGIMPGYYNLADATAEAITEDGWFHTGDIGKVDAMGYLRITDRKKDLIVTAGGKNVAPQKIENLLKARDLISQAVVYGDARPYLTALLTLDAERLKSMAHDLGVGDGSYAELTQHPDVYARAQEAVDAVNVRLASYETIKKFKILEHDLSQKTGELTPTLKVKRRVINERYESLFHALYA